MQCRRPVENPRSERIECGLCGQTAAYPNRAEAGIFGCEGRVPPEARSPRSAGANGAMQLALGATDPDQLTRGREAAEARDGSHRIHASTLVREIPRMGCPSPFRGDEVRDSAVEDQLNRKLGNQLVRLAANC
jgi:hypothetical protein